MNESEIKIKLERLMADSECVSSLALAAIYNEVAEPLSTDLIEYNKLIDEGKIPRYDNIVKRSAYVRQLYENYRESPIFTQSFKAKLFELNTELEKIGYPGVHMPSIQLEMVTLPYLAQASFGFSDEVTDRSSAEFQMTLSEASALRGENRKITEIRLNELLNGNTKEAYEAAFRQLYREKRGELLALDIETNSLSPAQGNIIEFGCVSDKGEIFDELYSPTDRQLKINGVGKTELHNISREMVEGCPTFEERAEHILSLIRGRTIVVHNKNFELNWFRQQIPGFIEAEVNGEIRVVDTMHICRKFCPTERNRLQDFVEYTGGTYENAHRSSTDAKMTLDALLRWLKAN